MDLSEAPVTDVRPMLSDEREDLLHFLRALSPDEWLVPTAAGSGTVKDVPCICSTTTWGGCPRCTIAVMGQQLSAADLVEMSTELPEVVLKEGLTWTNITFRGRGFAWVDHAENRAVIKAHRDEYDALVATAPVVYEAGWVTDSSAWVRVQIDFAEPEEVFELLEEAWRMTATKRAIRELQRAREH